MDFFLDTASIDDVLKFKEFIQGITTNPSLLAAESKKTSKPIKDILSDLCMAIEGPVSAEVISNNKEEMLKEAKVLSSIAHNIVIKLPLTKVGLEVCKILSSEQIFVNVTLCFSAAQALLAAKAGASFISPFVGRLDDYGASGIQLISDIKEIFDNDPDIETTILAASIRNSNHVIDVAKAGADVSTVPPKVMSELFEHPLTKIGLEIFEKDFKGLSII